MVNSAVNSGVQSVGRQKPSETFTFSALPTNVNELRALPRGIPRFRATTALDHFGTVPVWIRAAALKCWTFSKARLEVSTYENSSSGERLRGKE